MYNMNKWSYHSSLAITNTFTSLSTTATKIE